MERMAVFCLSLHAAYRCRHAGACCQANWTIPVEPQVVRLVESRDIRMAGYSGDRFTPGEPGSAPGLARMPDGACVFFDRHAGRLCSIHRAAGPEALPSACRHFPRVVLNDDRGTLVTLSHYCPTAAVMLLDASPIAVVEAAPPLRLDDMEGLDARGVLPPLLRPGVLADLEGYDAWERACIRTLARRDLPVDRALGIVAAATARVREWSPGVASLTAHVEAAFDGAREAGPAPMDGAEAAGRFMTLRALAGARMNEETVPPEEVDAAWNALVAPVLPRLDHAVANYLAARLFGNHLAYEGRGLLTILEWIRTCLAVLRRELARRCMATTVPCTPADFVEAVRAADYLLMHVVDSKAFARDYAAIEGSDPE